MQASEKAILPKLSACPQFTQDSVSERKGDADDFSIPAMDFQAVGAQTRIRSQRQHNAIMRPTDSISRALLQQ